MAADDPAPSIAAPSGKADRASPVPPHVLLYLYADLLVEPDRRLTHGVPLPWRHTKVSMPALAQLLVCAALWDLRQHRVIQLLLRRTPQYLRPRLAVQADRASAPASILLSRLETFLSPIRPRGLRRALAEATGHACRAEAIIAMAESDATMLGFLRVGARPGIAPLENTDAVESAADAASEMAIAWLRFANEEPALHAALLSETGAVLRR